MPHAALHRPAAPFLLYFISLFSFLLVGSAFFAVASPPSPSHSVALSQLIPLPPRQPSRFFFPAYERAHPFSAHVVGGRASAERTRLCNSSRHIGELRQQLCAPGGGVSLLWEKAWSVAATVPTQTSCLVCHHQFTITYIIITSHSLYHTITTNVGGCALSNTVDTYIS